MPALPARALDAWIPGAPPAAAIAPFVLLYGGDEGGITALAADLVRAEGTPVRWSADTLTAADLRAHLSTGGLFGPQAPVRISGATDKHVALLKTALEGLTDTPRVVIEAGALKKDSKLKALFDTLGSSIVLHPLDAKGAGAWLTNAISTTPTPLAKGALAGALERLPADRMRLIRLAEVLSLHATGRGAQAIEAQDITALVGHEGEVDLTQALMAALQGQTDAALVALDRQLGGGENPIALLRAWSWKIQRLDDMIRSGLRPAQAVAAARPPVFFTERAATERALTRLGAAGIGAALEQIDATERAIVHSGHPARLVMERWLVRLSHWKA